MKITARISKKFLNKNQLELVKSAIDFAIEQPSPFSSKILKDKLNKNQIFFMIIGLIKETI